MAVWQIVKSNKLVLGKRLDPEIYRPSYTKLLNSIMEIGGKEINVFKPTINRGKLPVYSSNEDVYVIKSAKIQNGFIDESDEYTENSFIEKYPESEAKYGDILINSTGRGTLGRSAIFTKKDNRYIIDGHVSKITKLNGISNFYLSIFLLSKYGYTQLDTMARGSSGQTEIYPEDIGAVIVPDIPDNLQIKIETICKNIYEKLELTKNYYHEAEQGLLERIQWNKINTKHVLNYKATSKNILENERIDPEFYQPKFDNLIKHLKKIGSIRLGDFCSVPNRGIQPVYVENGEVLVINSKHLGPTQIDIEGAERTNVKFYNEENTISAKLGQFDVLMYSTGAYVGRTNVYLENIRAIASNHVTIIRPDRNICNPIYLALFLNSFVGLMQTDRRASGSAQREIYPQEIIKYEIFIPKNRNDKPDLEWQNKLSNKVIQAYNAKNEAKQKIKEAKEMVEKEIDKLIKN